MSRKETIARLLPFCSADAGDDYESRKRLVRRLEAICAAERERGLSGHWAYDETRHRALYKLLLAERSALLDLAEARESSNA